MSPTGAFVGMRIASTAVSHSNLGEGTSERAALACKLMVQEGMRVREVTTEIRYCLRNLGLEQKGSGR